MTLQRYNGNDVAADHCRELHWVKAEEAEAVIARLHKEFVLQLEAGEAKARRIDELQAELSFQAKRGDNLVETINELQAENERLRAALITVVAFDGRCDVDLKKIASDALKGGGE